MDATHTSLPEAADRRLVSTPFIAVTGATAVFFVYIGMLLVVVPRFVEDELAAGEFGVGLSLATFAAAAILVRPLIGWAGDRFGRRRLMMTGAVLAAVAGPLSGLSSTLWQLLIARGLTGIGEAALFVGAATMIADLAPAHRRAEAASYFSVAVFGGIGVGPVLAEAILGSDRYELTFVVAGAFALAAGVLVLAVPRRADRIADRAAGSPSTTAFFHPAAVWPGLVLAAGIAGFAVFAAFLPDYSRTVGLSGAGGLFALYSAVCLVLRIVGARLPERLGPGRSVTIALVTLSVALLLMAGVPTAWALWVAAAVVGVGMAFMYPSLLALVVNGVDESQRSRALSSFTMFFELGTVAGGLVLGAVGDALGKRAGFAGGALACVAGIAVLWRRVADPRRPAPSPVPDFAPVAGS